jgi:predicted porin
VQVEAGTLSFEADVGSDLEGDGTLFGVNAGYDRDFGRFVLGGEVQYERSEIEAGFDEGDLDVTEVILGLDSVFRAGVRAGFDGGRFMPYFTGGYARAEVEFNSGALSTDATYAGGYFGVGVDYRLRDDVTLGAQVLRTDFDQIDGEDIQGADVGLDTVGLRATYNF